MLYLYLAIISLLCATLAQHVIIGNALKLLVALGIGGMFFRSISVFLLKKEKAYLPELGFLF